MIVEQPGYTESVKYTMLHRFRTFYIYKNIKNHISSKHTEQKCKECKREFKTSMELVSHVAKEHHNEEEAWNVQF